MKSANNILRISCDCKDTLNLDDLTEFQGNLKERTEDDIDKIVRSIKMHGIAFPLFVWRHDGINHCLDGHGRMSALRKLDSLGFLVPPLPVVYVDCKDEQGARDLLLRLNSHYGKMTKESVLEFIGEFEIDTADFELPCGTIEFDEQPETETEGDDDVPEVDEKDPVISQRGEIYELGNSLLMCGDSTNAEDVARLMGAERADITFTSPPYNMQASGITKAFESDKVQDSYGIGKGTYDKFSDNLSDDDYKNLLCKTLEMALRYSDEALFNIGILAESKNGIVDMLSMFKDNFSDILVWNKSSCMPLCLPTQIHLVNHICELIFCFNESGDRTFSHSQWKLGTMNNRIDTDKQNANEYSKIHHATFPEALPEYVIKNFTEKSVLDLFGGTGTTLIAAEKMGRKCFMVELSERYCDVIRRRYTKWAKENNRPLTSGCLE